MTKGDTMKGFRSLLVVAAAATIVITWDLWRVRDSPPMLPLLALPRCDLGVPLLVTLAVILFRPRSGIALFGLVCSYAVLIDQTRLQPQFLSFTLLFIATLPGASVRALGRAHLITLWGWAGLNKLLSPVFLAATGPRMLTVAWPAAPFLLTTTSGYLLAATELAIAGLALGRGTRRTAVFGALALHCTIILVLARQSNQNAAVWPWNVVLGFAGFVLIAPWRESVAETARATHPLALIGIFVLFALPVGFHFGLVDAYLSHNFYSANTPVASAMPPTLRLFHVPFPPAYRLYEQSFRLTCSAGDTLVIRDRRWWFTRRGLDTLEIECGLANASPTQERSRAFAPSSSSPGVR